MANSLHFVEGEGAVLARLRGYLQPAAGSSSSGTTLRPRQPLGALSHLPTAWRRLARQAGFAHTELLAAARRLSRRVLRSGKLVTFLPMCLRPFGHCHTRRDNDRKRFPPIFRK